MPTTAPIYIYGDPHGDWDNLLQACQEERPAAVIILGDCELGRPIREVLAPLWRAGVPVHYIAGNHDCDSDLWYDNLFEDHPDGCLHAKALEIGGVTFGGLGGVFMDAVWQPLASDPRPKLYSRDEFFHTFPQYPAWRGSLPRIYRQAIFPEDFDALRSQPIDVLVCHEAPSSKHPGIPDIDVLASTTGARLIIHGHHHLDYAAVLPNGCKVRGVGRATVWRFDLDA
jgi:predicted phosphodiesterase